MMNHMNPDNYYEEKHKSRTKVMGLTFKLMLYGLAICAILYLFTSCSSNKPAISREPCDMLIDRATGQETPIYDCDKRR